MQQEKIRRRRENKTRGEVVSSVNRNVKRIPSPTCCSFLLLSTINRQTKQTLDQLAEVREDVAGDWRNSMPRPPRHCCIPPFFFFLFTLPPSPKWHLQKRERRTRVCVCMCTVHTQTSLFVRYKSRVQVFPSPDSPVTKRILRPKRNNFGWRTADNNKKKRPTQRIFAYL